VVLPACRREAFEVADVAICLAQAKRQAGGMVSAEKAAYMMVSRGGGKRCGSSSAA